MPSSVDSDCCCCCDVQSAIFQASRKNLSLCICTRTNCWFSVCFHFIVCVDRSSQIHTSPFMCSYLLNLLVFMAIFQNFISDSFSRQLFIDFPQFSHSSVSAFVDHRYHHRQAGREEEKLHNFISLMELQRADISRRTSHISFAHISALLAVRELKRRNKKKWRRN